MRARTLLAAPITAAVALGLAVTPTSPAAAAASILPIVITFNGDAPGVKPNGYSSPDSLQVGFFDTLGANLTVGDFTPQSRGLGLAAFSDDASAIEIRLLRPTNRLQLSFGNDDPAVATFGDQAQLQLFRGADLVSTRRTLLNRNDVMDQSIVQDKGAVFDRAVFQYVRSDGTPLPLIEIIDDIRINPLCTVVGTEGRDRLSGTPGSDVICAGGGNDTVDALGGNDLVFAGPGNDLVQGGPGLDELIGGVGDDILLGSDGADVLRGLEGRDRLEGGTGTDRCEGGPQVDTGVACEVRTSIP